MRVILMAGAVAALAAGTARAEVAAETKVLGDFSVTLHVHPFLTEEELVTLRLVQTNTEALAIFVPEAAAGHAAMAAAPGEGFIRDAKVVPSAVAIAGMADADSAATAALEGCEAARKGGDACVVVLEVAPAQ
jgi:hypothetical protein